MTPQPEPVVLPCGCFLNPAVVDGVRTLTVSPCRDDCPNLAGLVAEAKAQETPVERRTL